LGIDTIDSNRDQVDTDAVASGLAQQPLDDPFAFFMLTFAELVVPDSSLRVCDAHGRRVRVEGAPDCVVVVERDLITTVMSVAAWRTLSTCVGTGTAGV
jgi:hypothetical protein